MMSNLTRIRNSRKSEKSEEFLVCEKSSIALFLHTHARIKNKYSLIVLTLVSFSFRSRFIIIVSIVASKYYGCEGNRRMKKNSLKLIFFFVVEKISVVLLLFGGEKIITF